MWQWMSQAHWYEYVIICGVLLVLLAAVTVSILVILSKVKRFKIKAGGSEITTGGSDDDNATPSIIQHLEVRDYRNILIQSFDDIKTDIRQRIRKNGWLELDNWPEYVSKAIVQHDLYLTKWLDDHYYPQAKIERIELFEYNKLIWPNVDAEYRNIYQTLYDIVKRGHGTLLKKEKELQYITDHKNCQPKAYRCPNVTEIIRLTTELLVEENLTIREQCMIEAERGLTEIVHMYYTHYLAKFKLKIAA